MTDPPAARRSRSVLINMVINVLAWAWAAALGLVVTPILVHQLGDDGFGIRVLMISVTGYFALLDLGLNIAGTKYLAEYRVHSEFELIAELLGTTLLTFLVMGILGGSCIWLGSEWLATALFSVPEYLLVETIWAFRITGM